MPEDQTTSTPTPQQRIDLAEAETIEALRDILRAEAKSAAAEAAMMENLVEVNKAAANAVLSLLGQSPRPFLAELVKEVGKEAAVELLKKGLDWGKEQIHSLAARQLGRAEQIAKAADKEAVATGKPAPSNSGPPKTPTFSGLSREELIELIRRSMESGK